MDQGAPASEKKARRRRGKPPEPIMAWARRIDDGRIAHVSQFTRKEKGLGCRCVCAGCGGLLEAVNPGQSAQHFLKPRAHRMSFRHHAGEQGGACRRTAARAAYLQLLLDAGELQLPGYKATGRCKGYGGNGYTQDFRGPAVSEPIETAVWVDTHSAVITLKSGRVVRFQLRAEIRVDSSVDAVVTIDVNDPEVAAWDRDKIFSAAQLEVDWVCWEQHWDQAEVQAQADQLAQQEAAYYCDAETVDTTQGEDPLADPADATFADPVWLAGLTDAERKETRLHRELKRLLAESPCIRVGPHSVLAHYQPPKGLAHSNWVTMPACELTLSGVRLEQHLGNIVPDVVCQAIEAAGRIADTELLIEVAVTHHVDDFKRRKITDRGTPCLELDATRLAGPRRLTIDALRKLIQTSPEAFRWIYHPVFDEMVAQERQRMEREYERLRQIKEDEDKRRRAAEREARARQQQQDKFKRALAAKSFDELAEDYFGELSKRRFVITLPEWRGDVHEAYVAAFAAMGQGAVTSSTVQKLLVLMHTIRRSMGPAAFWQRQDVRGTNAFEAMDDAMAPGALDLRCYLPMLFICLRISGAHTDDEELRGRVSKEAHRVLKLVDAGSTVYARPPECDEAFRVLFPEFKEAFEAGARGTRAYAERRTREITEERHQRDRQEVLAAQKRRAEADEKRRLELEVAVRPAVGKNWTFGGGKAFERWSSYEAARQRPLDEFYLIREAYEAREGSQSVADFMRAQQWRAVAKVEEALAVLRAVHLLA